jgi:hypothetical protein
MAANGLLWQAASPATVATQWEHQYARKRSRRERIIVPRLAERGGEMFFPAKIEVPRGSESAENCIERLFPPLVLSGFAIDPELLLNQTGSL